jgi:hypothetical protein
MPSTKGYHKRDQESITNVIEGWSLVLEDAEKRLAEAKSHVRRLKRAIRTVQMKIVAGEPSPGKPIAREVPNGKISQPQNA